MPNAIILRVIIACQDGPILTVKWVRFLADRALMPGGRYAQCHLCLPCGGGVMRYHATIYDVTSGVHGCPHQHWKEPLSRDSSRQGVRKACGRVVTRHIKVLAFTDASAKHGFSLRCTFSGRR
jgi:hypothetical protein